MRQAALVTALLVAGSLSAQTKTSTIPPAFANMEGLSWHFKPFRDSNMVFQQIFSNDELPAVLKKKGSLLLGIGFRNEGRFVATFLARTIKNVTIRIAYAPAGVDGTNATTTFASNIDAATAKVVFKGNLNVAAHKSGQTNTLGTDVMIKFNQGPYVTPAAAATRAFTFEMRSADPNNTNTITNYNCDRHFGSTVNFLGSFIGSSCPSGRNSLTIGVTNLAPGGTMDVRGTRTSVATGAGLNWLGLSLKAFGAVPLPFDLSKIGFGTGCVLLTDILISRGVVIAQSTFPTPTTFVQWPIPNDARFVGLVVNSQYLVLDGAAKGGLTFSIAGQFMISTMAKKGRINGTYLYFTGTGNVATTTTANSGPWRNRADIMRVLHK